MTTNRETTHLLPNILVSAGRHVRSSKYHDSAVDSLHACPDSNYLVTASTGSRFVKVWRLDRAERDDVLTTEVTELQMLREHSGYLTAVAAGGDTLVSAASDGGRVLLHKFPSGAGRPRYRMARFIICFFCILP